MEPDKICCSDIGNGRHVHVRIALSLKEIITQEYANHANSGYIRSVADGIVHELRLDLPRAYLVIPALKPIITNVTDVTLIGLIYLVVENRLLRLKKPGDRHFLSLVHKNVVAVILILLALGDTVSCIYAQVVIYDKTVEVTESTGTDTTAKVTTLISGPTWYRRIHLAYATVYFAIALEIMACALYMHLQSSRALRSRVSVDVEGGSRSNLTGFRF